MFVGKDNVDLNMVVVVEGVILGFVFDNVII